MYITYRNKIKANYIFCEKNTGTKNNDLVFWTRLKITLLTYSFGT